MHLHFLRPFTHQLCLKGCILFLLCGFSYTHLEATPVSEAETRLIAQRWQAANPHLLKSTDEPTLSEITTTSGSLLFRKLAYSSGEALFIAANKRLPPVLAILPRGRISATHPLLRHLKADVEARLHEQPATVDSAWNDCLSLPPDSSQKPLLYVFDATRWDKELNHWNQESFNRYGQWEEGTLYNRYTPEHYMAGCVAIAGSAIQQFYAFPTAQRAYTNTTCVVYDAAFHPHPRTLHTRPGAYNWSILPKQWEKPQALTEEQKELIARIAANSGVITGTHYAPTASGGSTYFLMEGLRLGAGYATGMEYCPTATTPLRNFLDKLLYAQLRCGAPCVLDLGGKAGNHAVVATGIAQDHLQTVYTRLFFGWGGSGDVWYALPTTGTFHSILGVGTFISTDGAFLPIYGTLTHADGTPAANYPMTIAGQPTTTDAAGHFAVRIIPTQSVAICADTLTSTLTLDAALLHRAAIEPWAFENPNAVSTDALLQALPSPITLTLR